MLSMILKTEFVGISLCQRQAVPLDDMVGETIAIEAPVDVRKTRFAW